MNESNLEYLKKSLDYLGFGSKLNDVMEAAIRREVPKFSIGLSAYFEPPLRLKTDGPTKDWVEFTLDFNKAKENDTYYLNSYTADLRTHNGIERSQEFSLERYYRLTAMQSYRLLMGAALQKEVMERSEGEAAPAEKKDVWFKLNLDVKDSYGRHPLSKIYPSYGFSAAETVDKYPIVWQKEGERDAVIQALEKGAFPKVAMTIGGQQQNVLLSANPRMRNLDVYDMNMDMVRNIRIFSEAAQKVEPSGQEPSHEARDNGHELDQQSRGRGR